MSIFKKSKPKAAPVEEEKKEPTVRLDVLEKIGISEKAMRLREGGQYVFTVRPAVNKQMVKEEVERRYGVKVKSVNVLKNKKDNTKKAVVVLAPGQKIDV